MNSLLTEVITDPEKVSIRTELSSGRPIFSMGQFFVAAVRGQPRRITVKPGHTALEQSGMLKLQDVDYGGEAVLRSDQVFMIPASIAAALSTIPVLRLIRRGSKRSDYGRISFFLRSSPTRKVCVFAGKVLFIFFRFNLIFFTCSRFIVNI